MKTSKMIIVWSKEDLLGLSIEYLISANEDWKVVSISNKKDFEKLLQSTKDIQQDIFVVYQSCRDHPTNLLPQLLQNYPAIRIIAVSLDTNTMEVYSKQKIMVKQASDLIAVIEGGEKPKNE